MLVKCTTQVWCYTLFTIAGEDGTGQNNT